MAFDPFGDASTRGYLRNVAGETDRDRVKLLEHQSFAQQVVPALENLAAQRTSATLKNKRVDVCERIVLF